MFKSELLSKYLTDFKKYSKVVVIVDDDPAGVKAIIEARSTFSGHIPFVSYIKLSKDANEVLVEEGAKGLREMLQRADSR